MQNVMVRPSMVSTFSRSFGSDAKSETFLPVGEVTERVLSVVKNFEKVDPSKVCTIQAIAGKFCSTHLLTYRATGKGIEPLRQ